MERKDRIAAWHRRIAGVALATVLATLGPGSVALGHAELVDSVPGDGATLEATPEIVSLRFTEALKANSSIELVGPEGSIASAGPMVDDPLTMALVPPALAPGLYAVRWTAATDDGHIERGSVGFTIVAPPPTPDPTPSPTPSATATASPTATPTPLEPTPSAAPSPDPGSPAGSPVDPGTLLLLVGVAIVIGLATRRLVRADTPR